MSSAIILAPDPDRSADPTAPETDGQVTAQQIVNTWDLDADLVVLSACQSGLGRYAGGEGYLGFSQALFVKGARSLVLSLWEVSDQSTELLMTRFYRNLLGQREGLSQPLSKAQALDEAKRWLRSLTAEEVADLTRSRPRPARPAAAPVRRSYDHPYFWAGFILVGDPN
jgi:CHAT domain-containing protein